MQTLLAEPRAWTARDLIGDTSWIQTLSTREIEDIEKATRAALAKGLSMLQMPQPSARCCSMRGSGTIHIAATPA